MIRHRFTIYNLVRQCSTRQASEATELPLDSEISDSRMPNNQGLGLVSDMRSHLAMLHVLRLTCVALTVLLPAAAVDPPSVVVQWNQALLQGVRDSRIGPPMVARALAIAQSCIYEAWAAYDDEARGLVLDDTLRRPAA